METPFESYIQFIITGYFAQDVAVDCPEKLLQKYYRKFPNATISSPIKLPSVPFTAATFIKNPNMPSIYCAIAMPLFAALIFLNRKKYLKSYGIRCFTFHYIGIHVIRAILLITVTVYEQIWLKIYLSNIICTVITMDYSYDGPPEKSKIILPDFPQYDDLKYITFPRAYYYIFEICDTFNNWTSHIWSILLIFHRFTTYFACAYPLIFRTYFTEKLLWKYYLALEISTYLILHIFKNNILYHSGGSLIRLKVEECFYILELILHCIITYLSIYSILSRKYLQKNELNEMRYSLYFSIIPMIISFYTVLCRTFSSPFPGYMYITKTERTSVSLTFIASLTQYSSILLSDLRPIYDCLIFFIFVPHYRRTFSKIFCCKNQVSAEVSIAMPAPQPRLFMHRRFTVPH